MVKLFIAVFAIWIAWRGFTFLWNYFRPVRAAVDETATNVLNAAGLETAAKGYSSLSKGVENTVDANLKISAKRVIIWLAVLVATFTVLFWSFSFDK